MTILLALSAVAGQAQLWRGPAALEIQAREQKGGSVAGGQVKLVCRSIEPPDGPPPVTLDAKGRAIVSGLAEGKWHVEVSREGYMTYQADLDLRSDRKPIVLTTLQLNVPHAVHMMDVWFSRARSVPQPAPAIAAAETAPRPVPRQPEPPAPTPAQAAQPEPAAPRVEPQPVPQAPAPPAPAPQPPSPAPQAPAPAPVPAPQAPAVTPPTPVPAPTPAVRRRSFEDRTCFECKPGEAALSVEAVVPGASEGCGTGVRDLLARSGDAGLPAGCRVLRLTLPAGARYTGYRYEIQDGNEELDCLAGKDCPGGGRWPLDPVLTKGPAGTTVAAAFESGPAVSKERRAVMTVYYSGK
jgi:hypothetical protein